MRVYAHFFQNKHLISMTCKIEVCSSSSRPSVLAVLVVLPGFSKGGGWAKLEGLNRSLSASSALAYTSICSAITAEGAEG